MTQQTKPKVSIEFRCTPREKAAFFAKCKRHNLVPSEVLRDLAFNLTTGTINIAHARRPL